MAQLRKPSHSVRPASSVGPPPPSTESHAVSWAQQFDWTQESHVAEPTESCVLQVPPASVDASEEPDDEPEEPEEPEEEVLPLEEPEEDPPPSSVVELSSPAPLLLPPSVPLLLVVLVTVQAPKRIAVSPAPSTPIKE
jgi:hypothetical protein